jgi:Uma2 family endonuclease
LLRKLRLSPAQFALLCEANPNAVLELSASGQLIQMTPTGGDTNECNTLLLYALAIMAFPVSATNPIQRA